MKTLLLLALLLPAAANGQTTVQGPSPLTEALLLAQRPAKVPLDQWQRIIRNPTNATAFPIYLSQAMLDTLEVKLLDRRYRYVMVPNAHK